MLCNYLTEEIFQTGVQIYLERFKYSNAETIDLWNAFTKASGQVIVFLNYLKFFLGNKRINVKLDQTNGLSIGNNY